MKRQKIRKLLLIISMPQYFHFLFGQGSPEVDFSPEAGEGYKPFQIYKEQVLKRLEHTDLTLEKKQDCVISLFAYVHGLTALVTMPNAKYDLGWENKLEDLITTLGVSR